MLIMVLDAAVLAQARKFSYDEFCINDDGFCIENDGFCIENDGFSHRRDATAVYIKQADNGVQPNGQPRYVFVDALCFVYTCRRLIDLSLYIHAGD